GLRTRGRVPGLPEKPAKTVLACCLTAAGGAGLARGGLPLTTWALCLGAVSAVTFAVVVIPGAPRTRPRAPASTGLRGFLSGDDAATWLGAAGFVLLRSVAPAAWLPGLLAPLTGAILCHATRRPFARRDPFRGTG
ncbi:MAG TPA: hypothetical protein VGS19_09970, partial [Streptosporangiaceae bacterium]|nr:hypothetical protein [Streptosporangiaceae bacterium]